MGIFLKQTKTHFLQFLFENFAKVRVFFTSDLVMKRGLHLIYYTMLIPAILFQRLPSTHLGKRKPYLPFKNYMLYDALFVKILSDGYGFALTH